MSRIKDSTMMHLDYSINAKVDNDIIAKVNNKELEDALNINDILSDAISSVGIDLVIQKSDEKLEDVQKDILVAKTIEIEDEQILSHPIDIGLILNIDNEQKIIRSMEKEIAITLEIPEELKNRQWYKIIQVYMGSVEILESKRIKDKLTFYTDVSATYFILAGPTHIKNYNFAVPYYGDDKIEIEPLSVTTHNNDFISLKYMGKDDVKMLYNPKTFSDVTKDHPSKGYIDFLASRNIFIGNTDKKFEGNKELTRAEATALIMRLIPDTKLTDEKHFSDCGEGLWYSRYINTLYELEIVNGYPKINRFNPNEPISKQDFIVMIYRFFKSKNLIDNKNNDYKMNYSDIKKIANYATEAITYMSKYGIISGDEKNQIRPRYFISRYEAAEILSKTIQEIVSKNFESVYKIVNK